ncbi:MAG: FAD-dependent oxidoreductase, partial [Spirochaetales bacterium]|nr:FAD-dependent oxidoreductase [Spirochaetales bacterium]
GELDKDWKTVSGTEKEFEVDTICVAAGLTPLIELATGAGCQTSFTASLGGHIPKHDNNMRTSLDTIYVAGDIAGVEEASTAMEEGRLAGIHAAADLGFYKETEAELLSSQVWKRLNALRGVPASKEAAGGRV